MRHVVIFKRTADLARLKLSEQPIASFFVGDRGIERVDLGDDQIPRDIAVFDPNESQTERITLDSDPIRWVDLLSTAYRSGDYRVATAVVASAESTDELTAPSIMELEAIPQ